jgi:hypothetical protein
LGKNVEAKRTLSGEIMTQIVIGFKWWYATVCAVFVMQRISIQCFMQAVFEFDIQNEHENLH